MRRLPVYQTLASAIALALAASPAIAQNNDADEDRAKQEQPSDVELDTISITGQLSRYSALKSDTPIMETARSVSIETEQDILDKGALELADIYQYSAGVFGEVFGFATRGDWVRVRGLDVPEYRDSLQALFGNYNNTRPHVYAMEQVEILKGPASVLYGQGSPGGLVNVVTKRPREDMDNEVVVQLGNHNHAQLALDLGGRLDERGEWLYRVTAVGRDSDTMVDFVSDDTRLLQPGITWRPSAVTNISLIGQLQSSRGQAGAQFIPVDGSLRPAPNGQFIDDSLFAGEPGFDRYDTDTTSLTLLADHVLDATWSLEVTGRWTDGEADYHQAWPAFIGGNRYVFNDDGSLYGDGTVPRTFYTSDARSEQLAMDTRLRAEFNTGAIDHALMIGAQYQDVTTENDSSYVAALGYDFATGGPDSQFGDTYWINLFDPSYGRIPPQDVFDAFFSDGPEANTRDRGFYLNDQASIGNWRITAGLRYDSVTTDSGSSSQDDDALSLSVGALYAFDNGLAPYASYAESFEPVIGLDELTGAPLKPQEGEQIEVGIKYQPRELPGQITLAVFDIEQSNLPTPGSLPGQQTQQQGVAEVQGVELESKFRLGDFTWEANLSHLDTENANGFRFAYVPKKQASTWLNWRPLGQTRGFVAGTGARYVGEVFDGTDSIRTPGYTLYDLMVGYEAENWALRLNARNLGDKEYLAACLGRGDCFFGERRRVVATLTYRF